MSPPRTRTWRWLSLLGAGALLLGIVAAWPSARGAAKCFLGELLVDVFGDTEYAPGYAEAVFDALAPGTDEGVVLSTLGAPLTRRDLSAGTRWLYANGEAPEFATTGEVAGPLSYTILEFDDGGTFVGAAGQLCRGGGGSSQIDLDPSARTGRNLLGLDATTVDDLRDRRATFADLERRFGTPRSVRTSTAVREWFYSRSPTSTHHHVRSLGLDAAGKVCWKRRGLHWD